MGHPTSTRTHSRYAKRAAAAAAAVAALAAGTATANAAQFKIKTILPAELDHSILVTANPSTSGYTDTSAQGSPWVDGLLEDQTPEQYLQLFSAGAPALPGVLAGMVNGSSNSVDFSTFFKTNETNINPAYKVLGSLSYQATDVGALGFGVKNETYGMYAAWASHDPWYEAIEKADEGDYSALAGIPMWSYGGNQITFSTPFDGAVTTGAELKGHRSPDGVTSFTPIVNTGFTSPFDLFSTSVFASPGAIQYGDGVFGLAHGPALQASFDAFGFGLSGGFVLPAISYNNGNIVFNTGSVNAFGFTTPAANISVGTGGVKITEATAPDITTTPDDIKTTSDALAAAAAAAAAETPAGSAAVSRSAGGVEVTNPAPEPVTTVAGLGADGDTGVESPAGTATPTVETTTVETTAGDGAAGTVTADAGASAGDGAPA